MSIKDNNLQSIANEKYVSLVTYKKDGSPVALPIWVAPFNGQATAVTGSNSFKVKRLRNNSKATLTPCTRKGEIIPGSRPISVIGTITNDKKDLKDFNDILIKKYGIVGRLFITFEKLASKNKRVGKNVLINFVLD